MTTRNKVRKVNFLDIRDFDLSYNELVIKDIDYKKVKINIVWFRPFRLVNFLGNALYDGHLSEIDEYKNNYLLNVLDAVKSRYR